MPGHSRYYLIINIILLLFVLSACRKTNGLKTTIPAKDTATVNSLIRKGKSLQNSFIDSLPAVAQQLRQLYNQTGDKKCLVYADLYQSQFYWLSGDHTQAMKIAFEALVNAERWKVYQALPQIYIALGNLHKENNNYKMAFEDADKGLQAAKANKDTASIISLMGLRAMFLHGYYFDIKKPDYESLNLELAALRLAESSNKYERSRIKFYNNIAQTFKENKDYRTAIYYGGKAVALAEKYHQLRSLTYSYAWIGESYYYLGEHDKGMDYLKKGLAITVKINEPFRQMELYQSMYECYTLSNNYKESLTCLSRFSNLRDSLQIIKNEKQMSEMQVKYQSEKKDRQIELLNQSDKIKSRELKWIRSGMLIFLILFIVIILQYFIIRNNNRQIRANNNMLNEALLKIAFIQSHLIRKPMAAILGLINLIRMEDYKADKEIILQLESAAEDLDIKICDIIKHVEISTENISKERGGKPMQLISLMFRANKENIRA